MSMKTVHIPDVQLSLDELIGVVRSLEPEDRSKIAHALLDEEMDERFTKLIERLAKKSFPTDITDEEINEEIRIVRERNR